MCPTYILVHRTPPLRGGEEFTVLGQRGYNCFQGVNIPLTGWLHKHLSCLVSAHRPLTAGPLPRRELKVCCFAPKNLIWDTKLKKPDIFYYAHQAYILCSGLAMTGIFSQSVLKNNKQ